MKHSDAFNFKLMTISRLMPEKARKYQTPDEEEELRDLFFKIDNIRGDSEEKRAECDKLFERFDEIIRLSTNRMIIDTFPHDLEALMQDAESDLQELDPQRIKAAWLERRAEMIDKSKENADESSLVDGDTFTRAMIARCMEPYVQAFLVFGHDLTLLESLLDKYDTAQKPPGKEKKPKQVHIEALPAQALFALDNVSYQAFEGLLESADYGGQLQAVRMFTKSYKLPNGTRKPGKPVQVFAIMECKGADFSQPLDVIDGAILRGIYSLLDAGETRFTLSHVWNMIAGAGQRTNKNRIDDMCARVRRMIATTAKISYQQYAEETNMEYTDDITAQILPGVKIRERKNSRGEVVEAELFCQLPLESFPLYQFAVYSKQIDRLTIEEATVRGKDVDGKAQALTDYRLIIRELLLRRIKKHHNNKSDQVIRLEGLRDDPGLYDRVNATTTQQQIRARDTAENFLCEWIQLGTIYAYAWRKKGKTLDAILIANTPEEMENHPGAEWLRPKPEKQ